MLEAAGVDRTILVQVQNAVDETYEFLDMQRQIDFCADHGIKTEEAYENALKEYAGRRDIYGADALAWTALKAGRVAEAQTAITEALRLGTRDARLFYHAGMIARAAGNSSGAYQNWSNSPVNNARWHGAIPMISWTPEGGPAAQWQLIDIINGTHDGYIRQFAGKFLLVRQVIAPLEMLEDFSGLKRQGNGQIAQGLGTLAGRLIPAFRSHKFIHCLGKFVDVHFLIIPL